MKAVKLSGKAGDCEIAVGARLEDAAGRVKEGRTAIVTDANVRRLYGGRFPAGEVIEIGLGEGIKTLETVEAIYERLLALELDRSSVLLGIGGGIVTDITGFAASTYARGMQFGFAPTTLLAQVDAAIGGKNGVNLKGYKNMVGTIRQPGFVLCDVGVLKSLPEREVRNGYAEAVKQAAVTDAALFGFLEQEGKKLLSLEPAVMEHVVHGCAAAKAAIVQADEQESGERMKLNFGHTVGHAIEKLAGVPHGEAVSAGMVAECRLSVSRGLMAKGDMERVVALLEALGLPTSAKADAGGIVDAIRKDKKRRDETVRMPVLDGIGKARIVDVPLKELEAAVNDMY